MCSNLPKYLPAKISGYMEIALVAYKHWEQGKTKASHYQDTLLNYAICWMMGLTVSKYLHVEGSCSDMLRDIPSTHLENEQL